MISVKIGRVLQAYSVQLYNEFYMLRVRKR